MTNIHQALQQAAACLRNLTHAAPDLEAAVLLCHLLGKSRSFLYAWPEYRLTDTQWRAYRQLIERRLCGEPVAHITGVREFWSLALKVSSTTLIPRPETELLVERALTRLHVTPEARVADLGTGSGAIALAIASERPDCRVDATDISAAALEIARHNARSLQIDNVHFYQGDWCDALPLGVGYDLMISNPPYIAASDAHLSRGDLPREPLNALVAGADGLKHIRTLCAEAAKHLKPGAGLLLEHGCAQGPSVRSLLAGQGFEEVGSHRDLSGAERISEGRWH